MKEIITKFDLEAAFKALDEVEVPKVKGLRANRMNLSESTKRVDRTSILVEDYYDLASTEDLSAAQEEREAEIAKAKLARIEKIVDLEAETEDDILPTYVGKHIIQCPQCMTLFYKDQEDIIRDDENAEIVNVNEVCQHCGNDSGYMIIGKVAAEEPQEAEAAEEEIPVEDIPEEETLEEPAEDTSEDITEEEAAESEEDLDLNLEAEDISEEETEEVEESLYNSELLKDAEEDTEHASEHTPLKEEAEEAEVEKTAEEATSQNSIIDTEIQESEKQEPNITDEKNTDIKATEPLTESKEVVEKDDILVGTSCENKYEPDTKELIKEAVEAAKVFIDLSGSLEAKKAELIDKAVKDGYAESTLNFFDSANFAEPIKAAEEGGRVIVYTNDDYKTNRPELAELKNVKIVAVTELTEETEIKLELTDSEIDKMFNSPEFKKPISETEVEGYLDKDLGEEIDLDQIEDLNDKAINECISNYLTEVYSNVDSFTLTECSVDEKKLIIEGNIKFKSGKTKATIFEFTQTDKKLFEGTNTDFADGAVFKLSCSLEDAGKMLLAESLHYDYNINGTAIKGLVNTNN